MGLALLLACGGAYADPPLRVARLGYTQGDVSFAPAGQNDWVQAIVNRPLTTGDRLWADAGARAELQIGGAAIRLGERTDVSLLNLDDTITQLQLLQGALKIRVRYMAAGQNLEVDTPNLAFTLHRPGDYRVDVDPNGNATAVMVRNGEAEVYGDGAAYRVGTQQGFRFYGIGLSDYETAVPGPDDDLERWALERDRRIDNAVSARFVSTDVVGYEDLDANGTWRVDPDYGNVWVPTGVAVGWTPYRNGHWAWVNPWGWTWVDDAPWGYAVSHYGRWAHVRNVWCWVPGPARERAVYAPALVAFLGGAGFRASVSVGGSVGNVGWFPLGPREVYRPAYPVSRGYFDSVNRSNTVVAAAAITNIYNTTITHTTNNVVNNTTNITNVTKVVYANQNVPGAVVAVPAHAFVQSQPVAKTAVVVPSATAMSAPAVAFAAVAPLAHSVKGGAPDAHAKPSTLERTVVVRTAPPAPHPAFAAQVAQLVAKPGMPLDASHQAQLKPAPVVQSTAKVNVVAATKLAPPMAAPAPRPAGMHPADAVHVAGSASAVAVPAKPALVPGADAAKAAADKVNADKADAARAAQAKAQAERVNAAKAEADKANAARAAAAAKAAAERVNAARAAEAAKAQAAARAEAERANAARAEAAKLAAARAEEEKVRAAKAERARSQHAHASAPENSAK